MQIETKILQEICAKILKAVDSNPLSEITETLELAAKDDVLELHITNRDYYVSAQLKADNEGVFHATVNAAQFLKLVSLVTTDKIELATSENSLNIRSNGDYSLPMIYDEDKLLELPKIRIENETNSFSIPISALQKMIKFNSKELLKLSSVTAAQRMYYVDEHGCLTFSDGACVVDFSLPQNVKVLLSDKIVKLTSLFKANEVNFRIGHDPLNDEVIQTKVEFSDDTITLTAIIANEVRLMNAIPVKKIRERAYETYSHSVVVSTAAFLRAINRLLVFAAKADRYVYAKFTFTHDGVRLSDRKDINKEMISYANETSISEDYEMFANITNIKTVLENCTDEHINIRFGDGQAIVFARNGVYNVIPQASER